MLKKILSVSFQHVKRRWLSSASSAVSESTKTDKMRGHVESINYYQHHQTTMTTRTPYMTDRRSVLSIFSCSAKYVLFLFVFVSNLNLIAEQSWNKNTTRSCSVQRNSVFREKKENSVAALFHNIFCFYRSIFGKVSKHRNMLLLIFLARGDTDVQKLAKFLKELKNDFSHADCQHKNYENIILFSFAHVFLPPSFVVASSPWNFSVFRRGNLSQ